MPNDNGVSPNSSGSCRSITSPLILTIKLANSMIWFFSNNGFDIVDRAKFNGEEDTFHTVWGVCDEDLLNKTIKEADSSYRAHKPFMSFVMTTSNHRPYDYPNGRIDIPSHTGREGAVKYTDFAIGDFLKKAKEKPWFKNTIFVIVAYHASRSFR